MAGKSILKITVLVLIISLSIDRLAFYILNHISDDVMSGQAIGKLNHFLKIKDSTDLIVFGNSRANHHLDVNMLNKNAFNIGVDGTGIAYTNTLLNTLDVNRKQSIIIHIDTKNFFDENYSAADIGGLKTKYHRNKKITQALDSNKQVSFFQKVFYSTNYNGKVIGILKNYFRPNYNYKHYNGYDPLTVSETQKEARDYVLKNDNGLECLEKYVVNPKALEHLNSIESFVKRSDKNIIFVTSPIYNDICDEDNIILESLMKSRNLVYWDYTNLFKNSPDNDLWKDTTHMSKKGAENFTALLLKDYKAYYNN